MKERIILAPGLNGSELTRNLALHGINSFSTQVFSSGEFARYTLMRSGITITEEFINSKEENAIVAEAIKDESYFGKSSYSDIQEIAKAVRQMRSLVTSVDEAQFLEEIMSQGIFKEKNAALISVYKKYKKYLSEHNLIDSITLIHKSIDNSSPFDADFYVLDEMPLSPLEKKLIEKISAGKYKTVKIAELYIADSKPLKLESIKNCYGAANEVETIISEIYSGRQLDQCTVAVTDISTYGQLFFDNALLYNIPVTFGCGLPIINSNPARLLVLYNQWMNSFFGSEAIHRMIHSDCFSRGKLKEILSGICEDIKWKSFYKYLEEIRLTNDYETNKARIDAYKQAVLEDAKYIIPGESREYKEFVQKQKCIPLLEKMADELSLPTEAFISKYAYLRPGNTGFAGSLVAELDRAALNTIYEELKVIRESGASQSEGDIIINVLKMNVLNQKSEPGHIHITSIDKAICSLRENMFIVGLSSSKYPGSPKENHLILDADIKLFGPDAEYLTSENRIIRRREALINLAELASDLGSKIYVSYSGLNASELKKDNASSLVFELFGKANGGNASAKELDAATTKIGYFDPAVSASRLIGNAFIDEKCIRQKDVQFCSPEIGWNIDKEYSPTAIETFMGCPRSFMLGYILGIPEPEDNDAFEIVSPRDSGTMAHSLMEQLADNDLSLEDFLKLSGEFFDRYIAEHPPLIPDKVDSERDSFLEMMENAYKTDPRRKVILKEEDIHCTHSSGVKLHGFPDRVEELEDGSVLIVDFKTGRTVNHEQDDIETCLQVVIYAYLMESKGYKVSGGEFRYIKAGKTITCRYDDEIKAKLSDKLELFKKMMLSGDFPCGMACDFCKYGDICNRSSEDKIFGFDFDYLADVEADGGDSL